MRTTNTTNTQTHPGKKIIVDMGVKKELKEEFNTSYPTVSKALKPDYPETARNIQIRLRALEKGGVVITPVN